LNTDLENDIFTQLNDLIGQRDDLKIQLHDLQEALASELVAKGKEMVRSWVSIS